MKLPVYSVRDTISNTFGAPMLSSNDFTMMRSLAENVLNGSARDIAFSPKDYDLYKIGEYDLDKGVLEPMNPVVLISGCVEVIQNYGYKKE